MAKKILIVDDSSALRQVVKIALESAGYQVTEAEHGQDGLNKLKTQTFNMILSDVNMPVMDGITFVSKLKEIPEYKFCPVIMLTTEKESAKKFAGQSIGAKAWVLKPFKPNAILNAVEKLMM